MRLATINSFNLTRRVPWTPASISTALWLDADDGSTITLVSGKVSEWRDKSGNNRHATQANASYRPTTAAFNSKNSIFFQGFQYLDIPNNWFNNLSTICCYAVSEVTPDSTNTYREILAVAFASGSAFIWYSHYVNRIHAGGRRVSSDSYVSHGIVHSTAQCLSGFERNFSVASQNLGLNGTWDTKNFANAGTTGTPSLLFARIGAWSSTLIYKNGKIGEVIVLTSMPATSTRQQIEGYLARKWGLTNNLPSSHPYRLLPPSRLPV